MTNNEEENGVEELLEDDSLRKDCTVYTACKKEATYDTICVVLGRGFGQESEVVVAIQLWVNLERAIYSGLETGLLQVQPESNPAEISPRGGEDGTAGRASFSE